MYKNLTLIPKRGGIYRERFAIAPGGVDYSCSPHQGAGWRLCLECLCEGIGVGSVFIGFSSRLDLDAIIRNVMT